MDESRVYAGEIINKIAQTFNLQANLGYIMFDYVKIEKH